jgi:ABC-type dipeptide/oligopeptide/nickel transport system permease subunit
MKWARNVGIAFLVTVALACVLADFAAPSYARQFRDEPGAAPSRQHLLGTDDLGRDRFARVLYGTRVAGGWVERIIMAATDLFLSLPWLFLLITVRALLPLNVSPITSVAITFALLGCLGWAAAARVICADARSLARSDFILLARASGSSGFRLLWRQVVPNLRPIVFAQFWISIPVFILAEANLGVLGLGVAEPLPSWGSLLRELQSYSAITGQPWQFVPLILFVVVVSCFHLVLLEQESPA